MKKRTVYIAIWLIICFSMYSCKPKVPYTQFSVSEIRNMVKNNTDSLFYIVGAFELYWLNKDFAIETANYLDNKFIDHYFTKEYGLYLSDSLIAIKLIKYLQNTDLETSRNNYPSYFDDRHLFQALLNQDNSLTQFILNESLHQWNDTAKTLIPIMNPSQEMKLFMSFVLCRILYIHEILTINQSTIKTPIDTITINNALYKINYTYECLRLNYDTHSPTLVTTIKLKTECHSLHDFKINRIKYIKSRMAQFEAKHGAQFVAIIDKTKAIIRLHDNTYSEQYLIELINSTQINIYLIEQTIS